MYIKYILIFLSYVFLSSVFIITEVTAYSVTVPYKNCCSQCSTFYVEGDLLYWSAWPDNLEYTWKLTPVDPGNVTKVDRDRKAFKNEWDLGFRVGAGYVSNNNGWGLSSEWTHFKTNFRGSTSTDSPILATTLIQTIGNIPQNHGGFRAMSAQASYELDYDTLDIQVGTEYYISSCLHFYPHIGVTTAWIDEKIKANYLDVFQPEIDAPFALTTFIGNQSGCISSEATGIGPKAGFSSYWHFLDCFKIHGEIDGAILCMDVDNEVKRIGENDLSKPTRPNYTEVLKDKNRSVAWPYFHLGIGLNWNHCFCSSIGIELELKYEALFWWQNSNKNLSINGVTFSGRLQF